MDVLSDAVAAMRLGTPHSSRTERRAPWGMRFTPQDGAGFHVLLQGSCLLIPVRGEPIRLEVGDVAFLPRELGHAIADGPDTPLAQVDSRALLDGSALPEDGAAAPSGPVTVLLCGAYRLDQTRTHPLLAELPDVVHLPARLGRHPSLRNAIELLGRELDTDAPGSSGAVAALLELLLLYLLRAWHLDRDGATGWSAALRDPAVRAALQAVHRDPAAPWTVKSLGAQAGLSRSVFAHRFTSTVGVAPQAYLTWWRMTIAARLLRETDETLRVIAARSGYGSEYAFAKAFKREFGTAPGRFRAGAA
ncbi:AraC family transcriptional regulator [Nocardia sp. BMG51109]|uniref:AraC family transcriptional regulator n=1 Tax=Nocardia sp. BMG51109 TaxID=1056816 RepID=UPI0004639A33|nr:AraC family transcriptional regulator [Nocardia sp. BMG51109]